MKYASEVIELMGAFPGRDFRMIEILRYVVNGREVTEQGKRAMRKGVLRAIDALAGSGVVLVRPPSKVRGGFAVYRWE